MRLFSLIDIPVATCSFSWRIRSVYRHFPNVGKLRSETGDHLFSSGLYIWSQSLYIESTQWHYDADSITCMNMVTHLIQTSVLVIEMPINTQWYDTWVKLGLLRNRYVMPIQLPAWIWSHTCFQTTVQPHDFIPNGMNYWIIQRCLLSSGLLSLVSEKWPRGPYSSGVPVQWLHVPYYTYWRSLQIRPSGLP
jgi:hypothetical protein